MKSIGEAKARYCVFLIACAIMAALLAFEATAADKDVPTGPDQFNLTETSRFTGGVNGTHFQVEAGNVTGLVLYEQRVTKSWAGFFGNVTGTIILADSNNNTMYNWQLYNPQGEVYASNGSDVTWSNIKCVNYTGNLTGESGAEEPFNITHLENFFNMNNTDTDGINETFNDTYNDETGFQVGEININNVDMCPMAYTFIDNEYQTESFKEVLLHDNKSIIFTALMNDSVNSFKVGDEQADFQMLVAEDGKVGSENILTDYYFYVELN